VKGGEVRERTAKPLPEPTRAKREGRKGAVCPKRRVFGCSEGGTVYVCGKENPKWTEKPPSPLSPKQTQGRSTISTTIVQTKREGGDSGGGGGNIPKKYSAKEKGIMGNLPRDFS